MRRNAQSGFSLIELLIAMVVTFFIVGAMVGLLTGGQTSFKTQPERTDRQQNIRIAMDVIMKDIGAAGVGMPVFMQTFQRSLNNVGPALNPDDTSTGNEKTDQIALFANTEGHPNEPACFYPGGNASHVFMVSGGSRVPTGPAIVVMTDGRWVLRNATGIDPNQANANGGKNAVNCDTSSKTKHADIDFNYGQDPMVPKLNTPSGLCEINKDYPYAGSPDINLSTCIVDHITAGDFVQYMVCTPPTANLCPTGEPGVPNLYRNVNLVGWQLLARGIENMQVQYANSDGTATNEPPVIVPNTYTTLTTQVRVTLASRSSTGKFQGSSSAAQGPFAIRGSLTSQGSPRIALWALTAESPAPATPRWN